MTAVAPSDPAPAPPADRPQVLSLVGPRGSGKTTIGRLVAERLGVDFADADEELTARAGRSIPAIFATDGEPAFRALEAETIADLLTRAPLVLATGGGAVLNSETRRRLKAAGPVAYLAAPPATLHARTAGDPNRPPLTDLPAEEEVAAVLAEREPLYREVADAVVPTDGLPEFVAERVLALLDGADDG